MRHNKNTNIIVLIVACAWVISFATSRAQRELTPAELNPRDASLAASYAFRLRYNQSAQTLTQDASAKYQYNIIIEFFDSVNSADNAPFSWTVVSRRGSVLSQSGFDPLLLLNNNAAMGSKDFIIVKAPYFANAESVVFYKKKEKLFTVPVLQSSFCNENAMCDSSVGESKFNCAIDCDPNYKPAPSPMAPATSSNVVTRPEQISPITEPRKEPTSSLFAKTPTWIAFVVGLVLLIILFALFFTASRIKNKN